MKVIGAIAIIAGVVGLVLFVAKLIADDQKAIFAWEKACSDRGGQIHTQTHQTMMFTGKIWMPVTHRRYDCVVNGQIIDTLGHL